MQNEYLVDANGNSEFELLDYQKFLLSITIMEDGSYKNTMCSGAVRLKGEFDRKRMERAMQKVIDANDALRTVIVQRNGEVYQKIRANVSFELKLHPTSGATSDERYKDALRQARIFINQDMEQFDTEVTHFEVFEVDDDDHLLLTSYNHMIADGQSVGMALIEILHCYEDENYVLQCGSFLEFCNAERTFIKTEEGKAQLNYWKNQTEGYVPFQYTSNECSESLNTLEYGKMIIEKDRLNKLGRRLKTSPFNILMLASHLALCKHYNVKDTIIIFAAANRNIEQFRNTFGLLVRSLDHRLVVDENESLESLLAKVTKGTEASYSNQRTGGRNPMSPFFFTIQVDSTYHRLPKFDGNTVEFVQLDIERDLNVCAFIYNEFNKMVFLAPACDTTIFGKEICDTYKKVVGNVIELLENKPDALAKEIIQ